MTRKNGNVRSIKRPKPSEVYPGLSPGLDQELQTADLDLEVNLCDVVAKLPSLEEQWEFLKLHAEDPERAEHWASLEAWKRPLADHYQDDRDIYKTFTCLLEEVRGAELNGRDVAAVYDRWLQYGHLIANVDRCCDRCNTHKLGKLLVDYVLAVRKGTAGDPRKLPWREPERFGFFEGPRNVRRRPRCKVVKEETR